MASKENHLHQLKDTINALIKRVEILELTAQASVNPPQNKSKRFKKGDRVRILTTTQYGKQGDEAIVIKVGVSRYTLIILATGQIAVRDFKSVEKA